MIKPGAPRCLGFPAYLALAIEPGAREIGLSDRAMKGRRVVETVLVVAW